MTRPDRERVEAIFDDALELPADERVAFIAAACAGDDALAAEVLSLLRAHDRASGILESPISPASATLPLTHELDTRIGPYRITGVLGQGGMGVVYRAERDDGQFRRDVAIKVMRVGPDSAELSRRLESERQILAVLDHPNIARLFDGGLMPDGRPYLVIELIEGVPIDEYCDSHRLSIEERLDLFCDVARAVHHAHRNLIVHRDLKPTNILVTPEGVPKLLDFGIAKVLEESPFVDVALLTRTGLRLMTPEYASPEQIRGEPITTANDVYGLGIVLFELLCGRRPFDLSTASAADAERIILWKEPPRPATLFEVGDDRAEDESWSRDDAASKRRSTPQRLARQLGGDLDRIVLMALRKEPERRYASALQLAEDVASHLAGRPIIARGDSALYRARTFVSRHRWGVAAAALVAFSLIGGIIATATQARRASRAAAVAIAQRARAEQEAQKAAATADLMMGIFRLSDPTESLGDTITAREILDRGTDRILREFETQPGTQADLLSEVARVYTNLGLLSRAEPLVRRALELRERTAGPASLEASLSLGQLGQILAIEGRRDTAAVVLERGIAVRSASLEAPDSVLTVMQTDLAWQLRSMARHDEAAALFRDAYDTQRRLLGDESPLVASSMLGIASVEHDRGDFDAAEAMFRRALLGRDGGLDQPHPLATVALLNIGMIRRIREQYVDAAPLLQSGLAMAEKLYGDDHPTVFEAEAEYGAVLERLARYDEAERLLRDVVDRGSATLGNEHQIVRSARDALHSVTFMTGRYALAQAFADTSLAVLRRINGDDHPAVRYAWIRSTDIPLQLGRLDDAERRFDAAVGIAPAGDEGVYTMLVLEGRARIAIRRGRLAAADSFIGRALVIGDRELRANHRYNQAARRTLAELRILQGRGAEVIEMLDSMMAQHDQTLPARHPLRAATLLRLGEAQLQARNAEAAERSARNALLNLEPLPQDHWMVGDARSLLGAALTAQGNAAEGSAMVDDGVRLVSASLGVEAFETRRARARRGGGG